MPKGHKNKSRPGRKTSAHITGAGAVTYDLTKIDVAAAHIRTAVRLFFEDSHPVPIYTLASAAREMLTFIGEKTGVETIPALASKGEKYRCCRVGKTGSRICWILQTRRPKSYSYYQVFGNRGGLCFGAGVP